MKQKHELHEIIADFIARSIDSSKYTIERDPACGGDKHLPFFMSGNHSYESQVSKVDLLILKENKVKLVCEIEESGFNPTKIYGKIFSTASAKMARFNKKQYDLDEMGIFIQIISKNRLEEKIEQPKYTNKYDQGLLIEKNIRKMINTTGNWIKEYHLIFSRMENGNIDMVSSDKLKNILKNL